MPSNDTSNHASTTRKYYHNMIGFK